MDIENLKKGVWDDLNEIRMSLTNLTIKQINDYVSNNPDDVETLKKNFIEKFKDIPDDDPLRIEYLITLGQMGVIIYK